MTPIDKAIMVKALNEQTKEIFKDIDIALKDTDMKIVFINRLKVIKKKYLKQTTKEER